MKQINKRKHNLNNIGAGLKVLLLLLVIIGTFYSSEAQVYNFKNYGVENGLPGSNVYSITQDNAGYLWFGTNEGISKFDGRNFKTFKMNNGLAENSVTAATLDAAGNMWIGHQLGGISFFNAQDETFNIILRKDSLHNKFIHHIFKDKLNNLWFCSVGTGLYKLPEKNQTPENAKFEFFNTTNGLADNKVFYACQDKSDRIWFATFNGISITEDGQTFQTVRGLGTDKFRCVKEDRNGNIWLTSSDSGIYIIKGGIPEKIKPELFDAEIKSRLIRLTTKDGLAGNNIYNISFDSKNEAWVSASGFGISKIKLKAENIDEGFNIVNYNSHNGLSYDNTRSIFVDREDNHWIGTIGGGVSQLRYNYEIFKFYTTDYGIINNQIWAVTQDKHGIFWFGSDEGLSSVIFPSSPAERPSIINFASRGFPFDQRVTALSIDSKNNLWVGTSTSGVFKFSGDKKQTLILNDKKGLPANTVFSITTDQKGNIWIATTGGVSYYNTEKDEIQNFTTSDGLKSNAVYSVFYDSKGLIWVATRGGGVSSINTSNYKITTYLNSNGLHQEIIYSITEDKNGNIWFGTEGGGLSKFDGLKFQGIDTRSGLHSDNVYSIVCDRNNNIWAGTSTGIDKYDQSSQSITHFGKEDGFMGLDNNLNTAFMDAKGDLWFGTIKGVVNYSPEKDVPSKVEPLTYIKGIKVFLKETVFPEDNSFTYKQNHLTFDFIGLSLGIPEKVRYQFKLAGFDNDWLPVTYKTEFTYSNLPQGNYTFMVKACNSDGVWNKEPAKYKFSVTPPWYYSWYAISFFILLGIVWILLYIRFRTRSLRRQTELLELTVEQRSEQLKAEKEKAERERERAEQSERFKQQFLTNMSHEIRTPMNAVIGMTNLVLNTKMNDQQLKYLNAIKHSSENLLVIINDILDISKIEAGKIEFENIPFKLSDVAGTVYNTLRFKAEEKGLKFSVNIDPELPPVLLGDPVRLSQVLINLAGNAIKFTEKGSVIIECSPVEIVGNVVLVQYQVKDTGIGIPDDKIDKIFESFTQASGDTTRKYGGTGLGLAISKHLIELQNGSISVQSRENEGSEFRVLLRYDISPLETLVDQKKKSLSENVLDNKSDIHILLVEDNQYNQIVAVDSLETMITGVKVIVAENGKEAIEKLKEHTFNLVLMDVQMPEMNGYDATQFIRNNFEEPICSIPIIAMTAGAGKLEIEKCYASGMNEYVSKPFDPEDLLYKISKLLNPSVKTN